MTKSILVIDDDKVSRELIRVFLEQSGYAVKTAADGITGLDEIQRFPYDLIILDI